MFEFLQLGSSTTLKLSELIFEKNPNGCDLDSDSIR